MGKTKENQYLYFSALGIELVAIELALIALGNYFDQEMKWPGYGLAGGALVGLIAWLIQIVISLKRLDGNAEQ